MSVSPATPPAPHVTLTACAALARTGSRCALARVLTRVEGACTVARTGAVTGAQGIVRGASEGHPLNVLHVLNPIYKVSPINTGSQDRLYFFLLWLYFFLLWLYFFLLWYNTIALLAFDCDFRFILIL